MPKEKPQIPVYLFLGLLESGKTSVIKDFLSSNKFSGRDKNLIILCEEGEEELPEALVKRSRAVTEVIEESEDFTAEKLAALNTQYKPTAVMMEYNGMWKITDLDDIDLPPGWFVFQVVATINGETFEIYQQNMKDKIVDCYRYADVIVFNRCDNRTRQQDIRRNIRAVNRRAQVYFESEDPNFVEEEPDLPYDFEANPIQVGFDDFGAWFIDMQDHPKRYEGKKIKIAGFVGKIKQQNRIFSVFGRSGMSCCVDDLTFLGLGGIGSVYDDIKVGEKKWGTVEAIMHVGYDPSGEPNDFRLQIESFTPEKEPEDTIVYFN